MPREFKLSEESAQDQLDIFHEYYDFYPEDVSEERMSKMLKEVENKILLAIRQGKLEISIVEGTIKVIQNLKSSDGETVEYAELKGRHKVGMGKKSENDNHGRLYALLGSITGLGEQAVLKLRGADLGLAESIGAYYQQI